MLKQWNTNPNFCQIICALNWDAYLNGCVLKREIIVIELIELVWASYCQILVLEQTWVSILGFLQRCIELGSIGSWWVLSLLLLNIRRVRYLMAIKWICWMRAWVGMRGMWHCSFFLWWYLCECLLVKMVRVTHHMASLSVSNNNSYLHSCVVLWMWGNGHIVPIGEFDEVYIGVMGDVVGFGNHMLAFMCSFVTTTRIVVSGIP